MKTYALTSNRFTGQIVFKYDSNGVLIFFNTINSTLPDDIQKWILNNMPKHVDQLLKIPETTSNILKVETVQTDLSFHAWWQEYNYKVGNKKRAEKLYKELAEEERMIIFKKTKAYRAWLNTNTTAQCYPETFLAQRRWENDFK